MLENELCTSGTVQSKSKYDNILLLNVRRTTEKIKTPHGFHYYYEKRGLSNVLHIPAFLVPWWLADGQALSPVAWIPDVVAAFDLQNLEDLLIQL
jgi:hypothetical protein